MFANGQFEPNDEYMENFDVAFTRTVCSGKLTKSTRELSKLHCRLVIRNGFSRLAPFKLEEANLAPYIVVFHDVVFEKEIEKLKEMSRPFLNQSIVFNAQGKLNNSPDIRISKVAWFNDDRFKVVAKITKRTEEMTGLSLKLSEPLQIQQYGIAGFYRSHYDGFEMKEFEATDGWNRIATGLFYVNISLKHSSLLTLKIFKLFFTAFRC
jgi:prolyl 4-hydroxylase